MVRERKGRGRKGEGKRGKYLGNERKGRKESTWEMKGREGTGGTS